MTGQQFNDIVEQYSDYVYRFILKSIGNHQQAEDVVQGAFERLWKNRDNVVAEKAKSYLFTTAYHLMIDDIRKGKREKYIEEYDTNKYSHSNTYSDLSEILTDALNKLPEHHKQLVLLRDYEGYSYKEIGEITNFSESQVKVYIFRARKTLKEYIGKIENLV